PTSPNSFFTGLWMSGAGPAADGTGIYYVTANGDPSGTRYDPVNNTEQSVVRLSRTTTTVKDLFTPSNFAALDKRDSDFGAGGGRVGGGGGRARAGARARPPRRWPPPPASRARSTC